MCAKDEKNAFLDKVLSTWISALLIKKEYYPLAETFYMFYDHICRIIKVVLVREGRKCGK